MTSWENLSDTKESYPFETLEYALAQGINNETAFNLWVGHVLRKIYPIISAVNQRNNKYLKRMHKFDIEVPKTVAEAITLDANNGGTLLQKEI